MRRQKKHVKVAKFPFWARFFANEAKILAAILNLQSPAATLQNSTAPELRHPSRGRNPVHPIDGEYDGLDFGLRWNGENLRFEDPKTVRMIGKWNEWSDQCLHCRTGISTVPKLFQCSDIKKIRPGQ